MRTFARVSSALLLLALAACADNAGSGLSPGGQTLADVDARATTDADLEIVADDVSGADTSEDTAADSDAFDVGEDAAPDAAPDAAADVADVAPDAGTDVTTDAGSDVAADAADVAEDVDADPCADPAVFTPLRAAEVIPTCFDAAEPVVWSPELMPESAELFPLGVQSGAARGDSILLWTRTADSFAKRVRVWRDAPEPDQVLLVTDERVAPGADGYTHVTIGGLAPFTEYSYAFYDGSVESPIGRSPVGRFRTALGEGMVEPIRAAAATCTSFSYAPYEALSAMASSDVDLLLHVGDMSYNDGSVTLDEFRESWRRTLLDPGYVAMHQRTSFLMTWDDHEIDDNWDPISDDQFMIANGKRAYFETLAVEQGPEQRLWHSYQWGDTAEFILMDGRSERIPSTREGADATYVSPEQLAWAQDRLLNSTAHFKVVISSVPITNMPFWYIGESDRWEGYAAQRDALLDFITTNDIDDVYFIAGDFHIGFVSHVEPDGASPRYRLREIAVGPTGNLNPLFFTEDQFDFSTSSFQNEVSTYLTFDPFRDQVRAEFIATDGTVLYDAWLEQ